MSNNLRLDIPMKQHFTPKEAADIYGVKTRTIYRWIEEGKLNAVKIAGSLLRIKREALINLQSPAADE